MGVGAAESQEPPEGGSFSAWFQLAACLLSQNSPLVCFLTYGVRAWIAWFLKCHLDPNKQSPLTSSGHKVTGG